MTDEFKKWAAGYFSWADQEDRMPKTFRDLEIMVEDAYNAGFHRAKLNSDQRILEFQKLYKDNPGMSVTEANSISSIRNRLKEAEYQMYVGRQKLYEALKLTSHQRTFLFFHSKGCQVCALMRWAKGDEP